MRTEKKANLCTMMMFNVQNVFTLSLCCKIRATKNENIHLGLLYYTFLELFGKNCVFPTKREFEYNTSIRIQSAII